MSLLSNLIGKNQFRKLSFSTEKPSFSPNFSFQGKIKINEWKKRSYSTEVKVPIESIKQLRQRTLAGYSDCKAALVAEQNDLEKAVEWLKKKGSLKAAKKADRVAADGILGLITNKERTKGVITELNCETDFVSRGERFSKLSSEITEAALLLNEEGKQVGTPNNTLDQLTQYNSSSFSVADSITDVITKLGENVKLRRSFSLSTDPQKGVIGSYVHRVQEFNSPAKLGKIASLIAVEFEGDQKHRENVIQLSNKLATHVVGFNPQFLHSKDITEKDFSAFEAAFNKEQQDKLADKNKKFNKQRVIEDVVLLEQEFSLFGSKKVKDVLAEESKKLGGNISITSFIKVTCGEGIEKKEEDFAKEVEKMIQ
eukprot:TRINITY_DN2254_c0_g1_i2.p1 TRINITY_DN2254_c0_g1~~TRINITY_DN2254_c0_g1_i2.p1  ORF type:complete len:369 (+),score=166.99 TRINITY_DN2254_c0_g1_i2:99-1205(+)